MRLIKKKKIVNEDYRVDFFSIFISSACYTGFIPAASGTFGSLFGLLFLFIPGFYNPIVLLTVSIIFFFTGIAASERMVYRYGDDPSVVVIDEVVGMWISLLILSFCFSSISYAIVIISFLTFRFFDIVKIFPAGFFDRMKSGFGIMMDDVIAGIYSGAVSIIIIKIIMGYINGNG
ncbi:MAG: phosphatidylglycerophosphatase A [Ignavibacteria bacterium]|nr:phosphatidylglycerophosphatase A [Ignavibacteria bacterium]